MSRSNRALRVYGCLAGGAGLIVLAALAFFLALRTHPSLIQFHGMTTVPAMFAMGLIGSGLLSMRSPSAVIVGDNGLTVMRGKATRGHWQWSQIALATTELTQRGRNVLKLCGPEGRVLAVLGDDLAPFDSMVSAIKARMAQHPSPARITVAVQRNRRNGVILVSGGVLFFGLSAFTGWSTLQERRAAELLRTKGTLSDATIVRKWTAPDGRTRRIEYRVCAADAPLANVEVQPAFWVALQEKQRIAVIAVPGRPDISRLAIGQIRDGLAIDPRLMLLLSAVISALSIVFLVVGALALRGFEVKWDSATRRPRLARPTGEP